VRIVGRNKIAARRRVVEMTEILCNERCENCDHVNRGVDDTAHLCYWVSDRCPFYNQLKMYHECGCRPSIETVTQWTGCQSFVLDEKYKKQNEESDAHIAEMHRRWEMEKVKG
jgi:hypothetical protein